MKAVSHYSLNQESQAKSSFVEILKIDENHELNPSDVSPKIVQLFEETKSQFVPENKLTPEIKNSVTITDTILNYHELEIRTKLYKNSLSRSILLPGLGHLYLGNKSKGWVLTSLSSITLGTMIYYIVETNNLQNEYLNETNNSQIENRYQDYNSSYKTRNILIAAYAAIWIYSQVDLLFWSDDLFEKNVKSQLSITNEFDNPKLNISFSYPIN